MYACKIWVTIMTGKELRVLIFEWNFLRKIFGPTLNPESRSYERIGNMKRLKTFSIKQTSKSV